MRKILRMFLVCFMTMFCGTVMAEDIIWQEDFSSYAANDKPSGGDYSYVCTDGGTTTKIYKEKLAGGTEPELLVSKGGG